MTNYSRGKSAESSNSYNKVKKVFDIGITKQNSVNQTANSNKGGGAH